MLKDLKVGDKVIRMMDGFDSERPWSFEGLVTAVTDNTIECVIFCDVPRRMLFYTETGINVNGKDYGWLTLPAQEEWESEDNRRMSDIAAREDLEDFEP